MSYALLIRDGWRGVAHLQNSTGIFTTLFRPIILFFMLNSRRNMTERIAVFSAGLFLFNTHCNLIKAALV